MSNLLPQEYKKSILRLYRMRFMSVVFLALSMIFVIGVGLLIPSLSLSKNNEVTLQKQKEVMSQHETSAIARSLSQSISAINQKLNVFSAKVPESPIVQSFIKPILSVQGSDIKIQSFNFELLPDSTGGARVKISGVAQNREALLAFTDRIKLLKGMSSVDLPIMSFIRNANVTFTISAVITLN
jgi:hypothetical protein